MKITHAVPAFGFTLACALGGCGGGADDSAPVITTPAPPAGGTTCVAPTQLNPALSTTRAFPSLTFNAPVDLLQAPADSSRWFVVEQAGVLRTFANADSAATSSVFLDITARVHSGGETGLLGMAFHPQFPTDPRVFVSYTAGASPIVSRISSFRTVDGGLTLDPSSEQILISVNQPEANHKGGHIAFGPDGYLYIGFGDGGGEGDMHGATGNGQNTGTLLGKILRIDVNATPAGGVTYAIPSGNPFSSGARCNAGGTAASGSCAEIFAYGLRNPWRFSFDRGTGTLWVADVGQGAWEEIDRVIAGGNYGWRCREGAHAYNASCGGATGLIDPVAEYSHSQGTAITGGFVYRGSANPALVGRYVFSDYGSGQVWSIDATTAPTLTITTGSSTTLHPSTFGEAANGELYLVDYGGTLNRVSGCN